MATEPLGLRQLMDTSYVEVCREFSCCDSRYTVTAPQCGHFLTVKGNYKKYVRDTQDNVVITLQHRSRLCELPFMEVYVGHCPALTIKYKGGFSRSLWIDDENEQHILRIKQPYSFFGTADYNWNWSEYDVHYPQDLDVRYKAALVGACVFISVERQRHRH